MTKAKAKTTKKKITQKNFKDYVMELLNASDSKGMTINSTDLLSGVEEKYDNEADISLAYKAIKDLLKKHKGSAIEDEESTGYIEAIIFNELKKVKRTGLEAILWKCANILRTKEKSDNRKAVLGLVFLKFVGDKFTNRQKEIKELPDYDEMYLEIPSFYLSKNVFFLNETARWDYIVNNASQSNIATIIDQAMKDIEEANPSLKGALDLNFFAPLNLETSKLKSLIDEINKISDNNFHDKDLIGRVYEYFLSIFSIYEGKAGEYYTPKPIVELLTELIEPYSGRIYDPCCGSGGMFVQSYKFLEAHQKDKARLFVFGQEANSTTYKLAKMNLAIRGIPNDLGIEAKSTFAEDLHKDKKMNYIIANPPFNLKDWFSATGQNSRFTLGGEKITPPESNANYAWILHIINKLDVNNGIAGFLLANGALSAEQAIRQKLIEQDKVEAIMILPREMFYSTDISVTVWIINNNKKARILNGRQLRDRTGEVLFVDLRTWNQNKFEKKFVTFDEIQIQSVKSIYNNWQDVDRSKYQDVPELCKSVTKEQLAQKDYSLVPSKYIEFVDKDLDIDYEKEMTRIQKEMKDLLEEEKKTQQMLKDAFEGIGYGIE
jgi:type I restriction enzyme M protein